MTFYHQKLEKMEILSNNSIIYHKRMLRTYEIQIQFEKSKFSFKELKKQFLSQCFTTYSRTPQNMQTLNFSNIFLKCVKNGFTGSNKVMNFGVYGPKSVKGWTGEVLRSVKSDTGKSPEWPSIKLASLPMRHKWGD